MARRIVIGGPINCGKSTLAASIYRCLQTITPNVGICELDVFSDTIPCILGQKPWEKRQKREHGHWQNFGIDQALEIFSADKRLIVLGDLPGVIDGALERMIAPAGEVIVLGKSEEEIREWSEFFRSKNIPTVLKVLSYVGANPPPLSSGIVAVGNLNRKVVLNKQIVRLVSEILNSQFEGGNTV